jgi:hypothetical protein
MVLRTLALVFAMVTLAACSDAGPEHTDFDPPDGGVDDGGAGGQGGEDGGADGGDQLPVASCDGQLNYIACVLTPDVDGVCILGDCVRACVEDVECADADACTDDLCFWGHCENHQFC